MITDAGLRALGEAIETVGTTWALAWFLVRSGICSAVGRFLRNFP